MRHGSLLLSLAGCAVLLLCTPATSHAAPEPAGAATQPDPETKKKARAHFAAGGAHYTKGRYKQAIDEFQKAYSFWKNPRILLNIAICYSEMNDAVQAVLYMRRSLESATEEQRVKLRTKIPPALQARTAQVADLEVVLPDNAEVFLNDKAVGSSPVKQVLAPGTVRVVAKVNGQVKLTQTLTLKAGEKRTLSLQRWPATTPQNPKGKRGWRARLARLPIYYVGAAALVTLIGTAALIGTGVRTEKIQDDYYGTPNLSTRDKGIRYRTATNVLIGITVTAGVAAGVLALFTDWRRLPWKKEKAKADNTRIVPSVGPGGVGLSASGRF